MPSEIRATYRVQLTEEVDFDRVAEIAPYLRALGVSHVYFSPMFQAAPGSTHGYDIVDHGRLSDALGGPEAHARMVKRLAEHGLGQVVDIVPNHASTSTPENAWWWDLLQHGRASRHAEHFDVDFEPHNPRLRGKVLLPILGEHYGKVLESGDIRLARRGGRFELHVYDRVLPIDPRSTGPLLARAAQAIHSAELAFFADALSALGASTSLEPEERERRARHAVVIERRVARTVEEEPEAAQAIDEVVRVINADEKALDTLVREQNYRLAFWRTARHELNYRRFFDITELAGLRMENEDVFQATHALVVGWVRDGIVDGIRVDHPDGLRDPTGYFTRLRHAAPKSWIIAEKILEPGETVPENWPIDGTSGYDFLNVLAGLFVDPRSERAMTDLYVRFTGDDPDFQKVVRDKKRDVLRALFGGEVERLTELFEEVCELHPHFRDYTAPELREVLVETIACLPVYRTYVRPDEPASAQDVRFIGHAIDAVERLRKDLDPALLEFLKDLLSGRYPGDVAHEFVARFQQLSGPAMAKGLEDTAFYCYHRLVALNEVGGNPGTYGASIEDFHRHCESMHARWPRSMLTTSTHDTKRSEDVRIRISLLSEIPSRWIETVDRWAKLSTPHRREPWPDRAMEYLIFQTLVGTWPISADRLTAYAQKAAREAKEYTSWRRNDPEYEAALEAFVRGLLSDEVFVADLEAFLSPLLPWARAGSLAQTLLKLTAPGIPDLYQGTEIVSLRLVDPDNREPVNFERLGAMLRELDGKRPEELLADDEEGWTKLFVTQRALETRARFPECFDARGTYAPLEVRGPHAERIVAFARGGKVTTVAPRWMLGVEGRMEGTTVELPEGRHRNVLTGEAQRGGAVAVETLLRRLPVALLVREEGK